MSQEERLSRLAENLERLLSRSTNRSDTIALTDSLAHVRAMQADLVTT